jgi:hypothetical protein
LDEELYAAIKRLFLFRGEVTSGQFAPQTVMMQALTAQSVLAARRMRAVAIFRVNADAWTLVNLSHANLQALPPQPLFLIKITRSVNKCEGSKIHAPRTMQGD